MKLYTNPSCHYCKRIKEFLNNNNIVFEEIVAGENENEWNELIRITGIGMTPTIVFQEEVWLPNRDFRNPEELVARIKHFEENPMKTFMMEERIDQMHNSVKNLALLLNQLTETVRQINTKVDSNGFSKVPTPEVTQ